MTSSLVWIRWQQGSSYPPLRQVPVQKVHTLQSEIIDGTWNEHFVPALCLRASAIGQTGSRLTRDLDNIERESRSREDKDSD